MTERRPAPDARQTIVQFVNDREHGSPSGLRVLADGQAELLGDQHVDVDVEGRATRTTAELGWRPAWRYDAEALAALRDEVATADAAGLDERYAPDGGASHPTTTTWRLSRPDGRVRTVVVVGRQPGTPAALRRLYRRMLALRPQPAGTSVWRVRVGDELVTRHVDGEPAGVAAIRPLVHALLVRGDDAGPVLKDDPGAPLLVEVEWRADGAVTETTRVHADGRHTSVVDGHEQERRRYGVGELRAITAAIDETGWATLPDPLVP